MTTDEAIHAVNAAVTSARSSLLFAAPESADLHWNVLTQRLTEVVEQLGEEITDLELNGPHDED